MQVKDLKPAGYNPRKISKEKLAALKKSLEEFGDLSGIVYNTRTQTLIGGHQRIKNLDPAWKIVTKPQTDPTGTTAAGYIETPHGRLTYREVDWPESKEKQANIAANKHGGEFDDELLKNLVEEIKLEDPAMDIALIGFDDKELTLLTDKIDTEENHEDDFVPDKDPNILVRLSFHPGIWLGKRKEILTITEKLKKTYECDVRVEE
jgi:hypothetical protein